MGGSRLARLIDAFDLKGQHSFLERLNAQGEAASRIGIVAVPTFIFGTTWIVEGAVPTETLREVARQVVAVSGRCFLIHNESRNRAGDPVRMHLSRERERGPPVVHTETVTLSTKGFCDIHDITGKVADVVGRTIIAGGTVTVFCPGSTCAVTTIEYETGVLNDLRRVIEELVPREREYEHDKRWGDGNGFSHVRAALLKPSVCIPLIGRQLALGTWQQVVFLDFDNRERRREIIVQVVGE